jgi:WD40 repeat protein
LRSAQAPGRWATTVRFTSDGRLVVGDTGGDVVLYDGDPLRPVRMTTGHGGGVWSLAVAPADDVVSVGSAAGAVHLHRLDAERAQGAVGEHRRGVRTVRFSPDGRALASGGADGRVCVWDTTSDGSCNLPGHGDEVEALAVSHHGTHLAMTGTDHVVRVSDTVTRHVVATFSGHTDSVSSIAFSPSGDWLASAGADRTARVWHTRQPDQVRVLTAHTDAVSSVAFSADGHRLATAGADRAVRVWEGPEWELLRTLRGHSGWVRAGAFSADGLVLATGGNEGAIRLWDPDSGQLRASLSGHAGGTWALAFRRRGSGLLSAGADGCVRLWHPGGDASAEELWRASHPVGLLTISPDDDRFACAVDDDMGTVRLASLREDDVSVTLRLGTPVTSLSWGSAGLGVGTRGSGALLLRYPDADPPSSAGAD